MAATIVLAMAAPTWAQAQGGPTGAMDGQKGGSSQLQLGTNFRF